MRKLITAVQESKYNTDRKTFAEVFQHHRSTYLRLFPNGERELQKLGIPTKPLSPRWVSLLPFFGAVSARPPPVATLLVRAECPPHSDIRGRSFPVGRHCQKRLSVCTTRPARLTPIDAQQRPTAIPSFPAVGYHYRHDEPPETSAAASRHPAGIRRPARRGRGGRRTRPAGRTARRNRRHRLHRPGGPLRRRRRRGHRPGRRRLDSACRPSDGQTPVAGHCRQSGETGVSGGSHARGIAPRACATIARARSAWSST